MNLETIRLVIDAGFMVLIWAVQLVIYPSFKYYKPQNLLVWHQSYTKRVTYIVLPLMVGQFITGMLQIWQLQNWYTLVSMGVIVALWLITFSVFVPLHQSIDANKPVENVCVLLVRKNWVRTVLWSLLFILSVVYQVFM